MYSRQMVYVQHATIHSNPVFKKQYHAGDNNAVQVQKKEDSDLKEKDDNSQSCCFLPVKNGPKDDAKESRKDKTSKNKEKKKSFDSVKALSNIIDSLEALKNHTYKKLQELESINIEIKDLKKHCEEPNEQRWLRKMEKIITRQKRYTLRTSRCCFTELKKLAKEYNIDKVLERKIISSAEEEKNFSTGENELQEVNSEQTDALNPNQPPVTCYNVHKQEKFSKKAQKLIKSFFEDIQENEEAQKTVKKDLELRKNSKWKLDDEVKTQASSVDGSKVFITQQMFKLGNFGNRFFTEVASEDKKEEKKRNEKERSGSTHRNEKDDKIIPLHRTDVVKFKNKDKLKKSSSSSSVLIIDSNGSEKKLKKKKSKHSGKKKEKKAGKVQKKRVKTQYLSLSSDETSEDEIKMSVISKRKSRKDLWENQSITSVRPVVNLPMKKQITYEKNVKRKLDHVIKEQSKKEVEMVVERIEKLSEKSYTQKDKCLELQVGLQISPERKKLKLDQKESNKDSLIVCKCEDSRQTKSLKENAIMDENQMYTPKGKGDSLRENEILKPVESHQECKSERLKDIIEGQDLSKRSWTAPPPKTRDNSADKKLIVASPNRFEKCIQRRATSPVLIYHNANRKSMEDSRSYKYELHNHENPVKTFIENWSVESERLKVEKYHFLEKEFKDEETHRESDSNDSNYEKMSKMVKSDVTILSFRSSENEEMRKDGKSRTMSAESFNSTKTIQKKKRRQRQSRKKQKNPSTIRILDTIESSRLEFSNLTEDEQLQIISANVASFVKQKLLEHKRYIESKENSDQFCFGEVEQAVLKELKSIGEFKNEEEDTDTLENQWSTAALNVPSVKEIEKPEPKEPDENEMQKKPTTKPIHNFIKKNKLLAGKYKRKLPPKKPDGPKKIIKPPQIKSTEPTSSDNKSPVRVVKPHDCSPILKSPQEKVRDRSKSMQNRRMSSARSPATPKEGNKRPVSTTDSPKLQPTVPPAVQRIPKPKKRWIPTYTLTSYLHTPLEVVENQNRRFLFDKEDKVEKFDLNTNDLEYLIKLDMRINNEIATNMENSMNYVKTILSQDYNGTAIIEKPPIKDSFNIFDPINNNGIFLIELHDAGNMTENVTDYETSETRCSFKRLKKSKRKRRRMKKKWSELTRLHESGDQIILDSDYNSNASDLDTKRSEKFESNNKDVSNILKKYIYHLGRGEESNIDLTEKSKPPIEEETIQNFKPHNKKRKEKLLLSSEMKEKLLEVLKEEMKQEFESKEKVETASSTDRNSLVTEETSSCECERTEMWARMLKNFFEEENNNEEQNDKDGGNEESDIKKLEEDTSRSFED